jgi:hypothetical protein
MPGKRESSWEGRAFGVAMIELSGFGIPVVPNFKNLIASVGRCGRCAKKKNDFF